MEVSSSEGLREGFSPVVYRDIISELVTVPPWRASHHSPQLALSKRAGPSVATHSPPANISQFVLRQEDVCREGSRSS